MSGDRRLKNIGLILEWIPDVIQKPHERYLAAITLLEGETIRHVIHREHLLSEMSENVGLGNTALALRTVHGFLADKTSNYVEEDADNAQTFIAMQCLRFLDGKRLILFEILLLLSTNIDQC